MSFINITSYNPIPKFVDRTFTRETYKVKAEVRVDKNRKLDCIFLPETIKKYRT